MLTVQEIQQHFIEGLNGALRRPGMYGPGEISLHHMLDAVTYVTEIGKYDPWRRDFERAGAWSSIGVSGVVQRLLPDSCVHAVASVYADYTHRHGWLTLDRRIDEHEYGELRDRVAEYCATDHTWAEVVERFGEPSVHIGGTNPRYDKVLGYATARITDPIVWFYRWNGSNPGEPDSWPVYEEPVLLAARCGLAPFEECFTFTPEGRRRRPEPYDPWAGMLDDD